MVAIEKKDEDTVVSGDCVVCRTDADKCDCDEKHFFYKFDNVEVEDDEGFFKDEGNGEVRAEIVKKRRVDFGTYVLLMKASKQYRKICIAHCDMVKKDVILDMVELYGVELADLIYVINFGEEILEMVSG